MIKVKSKIYKPPLSQGLRHRSIIFTLKAIVCSFSSIHSQLSRPNTARGSFTGPVTVGPTEV